MRKVQLIRKPCQLAMLSFNVMVVVFEGQMYGLATNFASVAELTNKIALPLL